MSEVAASETLPGSLGRSLSGRRRVKTTSVSSPTPITSAPNDENRPHPELEDFNLDGRNVLELTVQEFG